MRQVVYAVHRFRDATCKEEIGCGAEICGLRSVRDYLRTRACSFDNNKLCDIYSDIVKIASADGTCYTVEEKAWQGEWND